MRHEFHIGGFVRSDTPPPVLMARGCCGLLAARRRVAGDGGTEFIKPHEAKPV